MTMKRETWPIYCGPYWDKWVALWDAHGREVRGKPFALAHERYIALERERRLVLIVARDTNNNPVGYSCHHWYRDLNFDEKCGHDGLWYVAPAFRKQGIGRLLKQVGHEELKRMGVDQVYDLIRANGPWQVMESLGYAEWGTRWTKKI